MDFQKLLTKAAKRTNTSRKNVYELGLNPAVNSVAMSWSSFSTLSDNAYPESTISFNTLEWAVLTCNKNACSNSWTLSTSILSQYPLTPMKRLATTSSPPTTSPPTTSPPTSPPTFTCVNSAFKFTTDLITEKFA